MLGTAETLDLLRMTGYFMSHWLFEQKAGNMPPERVRLVEWFHKHHTKHTEHKEVNVA
jgi:hypothetical protein